MVQDVVSEGTEFGGELFLAVESYAGEELMVDLGLHDRQGADEKVLDAVKFDFVELSDVPSGLLQTSAGEFA